MAIAFEGVKEGVGDFSITSTATLACGSNADRCVVLEVGTDRSGATTINSATCNGNAMTPFTAFTHGSGYDGRFFYIAGDSNIVSGNNTIVATLSDGNAKSFFVASGYSGVDPTTPCSNMVNVTGFSTNITATVASAIGDFVGLLGFHLADHVLTAGTGTIIRMNNQLAGVQRVNAMDEPGAASVTINSTFSGGSDEWWATGFSLKAAGGAVATPFPPWPQFNRVMGTPMRM